MGKYSKGILGSFTGKVGTVVGSSWNGIAYMKSLPRPSSKQPTDLQMEQRVKLTLAVGFLKPLGSLLAAGFKKEAVNNTGFNVATSKLIKNAISGSYPAYTIDYSMVEISSGLLTSPWNPAVTSTNTGVLDISWTDNSSGTVKGSDKLVVLAYNESRNRYVFTTAGAERSTGAESLALPADFSGDTVHVWVAFTDDKKSFSPSTYIGTIVIA